MTIQNDLVHPDPTRERFNNVRVRSAYTAKPDDLVAVSTSVGPITVTLPSAPTAGACIAIGDDDDSAETNPITISSAVNIDGEATASIDANGAVRLFIFSGATWESIALEELVAAPRRDIRTLSIAKLRAALNIATATAPRFIDYALMGLGSGANWAAGSFTSAVSFIPQRPNMVCVGANVYVGGMGATRSLRLGLWRSDTNANLADETFNGITTALGIAELRWLLPVTLNSALAMNTANMQYRIGVFETSGTVHPNLTLTINSGVNARGVKFGFNGQMRKDVYLPDELRFNAGAFAAPTAFDASGMYCITPVFEDDDDA